MSLYKKCPGCPWIHKGHEPSCRFCGADLRKIDAINLNDGISKSAQLERAEMTKAQHTSAVPSAAQGVTLEAPNLDEGQKPKK